MREHETIIIFHQDLTEDTVGKEVHRLITKLTEEYHCEMKHIEELGRKKLAYDVSGCTHGWYVVFTYDASSAIIHDLERDLRANTSVLKYLTVATELGEKDSDLAELNREAFKKHGSPYIEQKKEPVDVFNIIFGIED